MSSPKSGVELKAGHPPAVKAGGMRIKGARVHGEKISKDDSESPWEGPAVKDKEPDVVVSGVVANVQRDFPASAVKAAHEKPRPTAVKPVSNKQINRTIQQPR